MPLRLFIVRTCPLRTGSANAAALASGGQRARNSGAQDAWHEREAREAAPAPDGGEAGGWRRAPSRLSIEPDVSVSADSESGQPRVHRVPAVPSPNSSAIIVWCVSDDVCRVWGPYGEKRRSNPT